MPTVIKIKELGLAISKENYSTKISINTLNIEKGLALFDIIKMYNDSLSDLENRVNASITTEAQVRITEDEALSRYMIDLEASVNGNIANINTELTTLANETSALASTVTTISASVDDLGAAITEQASVYAGYFVNSALPEIGNIKNVSGVNYQYLGGNLGPLSDGWVIYNNTALGTANQVKGWLATASSLVVNPSTGQVTGWQYGDGSGFNSFFTISASKITVAGETTFISNVVGGINSGTTTINGGQITTDTISALQLNANAIYGQTIFIDDTSTPGGSIFNGGTLGLFNTNTQFNAIAGVNSTIDGHGITGINSASAGAGVYGKGNWAVVGETPNAAGEWGYYTLDRAYVYGGVSPFTGAHIVYTKDRPIVGMCMSSVDAWAFNISQSLVHVEIATMRRDKKAIGIVSYVKDTLLDNIYGNTKLCNKLSDGTWEIKPEYAPYVQNMIDNDFIEVSINSLGEGGIIVSNENGNISNGDYLTSDSSGYTMKQDDDLLHSYTVAKALESVIWDNEPKSTKFIACTYHCG